MRTKANIIRGITAILFMGFFFFNAQGQAPSSGNGNNPNVRISVHKQTDENGNIISYDSTYTYIYSGKGYSDAYVDSIMKQYGANMNTIFFGMPPLNTPDISNYPFMQQFNVMDFDKLDEMMEKEMNDMMQNYGVPPFNGFFCQPQPAQRCCPKDSGYCKPQRQEKKNCPAHNKSKGGVQI